MLHFILLYPKYCKTKYCKQLQYLLKGKVLKKFPNTMKIESILQIQQIIQSKKKIAYSFSSVILKKKTKQKKRNNTSTLTKQVFRELIIAETFFVFHSSSENIKTNSMCSQHLGNTQFWKKQQVTVSQDMMSLHFYCTLEVVR